MLLSIPIKRIQLFEFEDFDWFPKSWRTGMTNLIVVLQKMMGVPEVLADLLDQVRQKHDFQAIVDTGSGSGGALIYAERRYNEKHVNSPVSLTLTDLNPNPKLVKRINDQKDPHLS